MEGGMARASGSPGRRSRSGAPEAQHLIAAPLKLTPHLFDREVMALPTELLTHRLQVL